MVRFVEVKGPGDSLSWAQKYWIDKLVRVGVRVEVARVVEGNERGFRPGAQRRKA
jgi:Fanconi-associated nuclease 1